MFQYSAWVTDYDHDYQFYNLEVDFGEEYHIKEYLWLLNEERYDRISEQQKKHLLELNNKYYQVIRAWRVGENYDHVPKKLYLVDRKLKKMKNPIFNIRNSFIVVNQVVYEALKDCNLGRSSLTEVYIYDPNTDEQLSDTPYYFLNLAERREFVDIQNSQGIKKSFYAPESPDRYLSFPKDGDIILSPEVRDVDVDIWHDPRIERSLFFSDRAMKSLRKAGFRPNRLSFTGCRTL